MPASSPLVYQAFNWKHGVFLGATMASETTAAATGTVGVVRRDPMAMLPFCGYNMGDYFGHWLHMGEKVPTPPQVFRVNWFRMSAEGKFLWPGFGDNLRVLRWVLQRVHGEVGGVETPIGFVPRAEDMDVSGIDVPRSVLDELLAVDRQGWLSAIEAQREFFEKFGGRMPKAIWDEHHAATRRLQA